MLFGEGGLVFLVIEFEFGEGLFDEEVERLFDGEEKADELFDEEEEVEFLFHGE